MVPARTLALLSFSAALVAAVVLADSHAASAYVVRPGDTLWAISQRTGASVQDLAARNHIVNPDRILAGQDIELGPTPPPAVAPAPPPPPAMPPRPISREQARAILVRAAQEQRVEPALVLSVAYWESGWNPAEVSPAGAIGMMQVTPGTANWAGPALLHRRVDLRDPADNATVGAALLRHYQDEFHDDRLALAAYYQGPGATHRYGIYRSSERYVDGVLALRARARTGGL